MASIFLKWNKFGTTRTLLELLAWLNNWERRALAREVTKNRWLQKDSHHCNSPQIWALWQKGQKEAFTWWRYMKRSGFLLVHDNTWPHMATVCTHFLDDEGIDGIDWPSCSPDLSPIENVWCCVSEHPKMASSTTDSPGVYWCPDPGLAGDTIHHFIRSMPRYFAYRHMVAIHTNDLYYELLWWSSCKLDQTVIIFFLSDSVFFFVFFIQPSSFFSQQITPCIWLRYA